MTAHELHQALKDSGYINADGFVTIEKNASANPGEGNGLLQTGLLYTIKATNGALTQVDIDKIEEITERCRHVRFPLLWRSPYKRNADDNQNWDDYFAWLAACYFAKCEFAVEFLNHGLKYGWSFDIQRPEEFNINYYFERMPGFVTFVKMCARGVDKTVVITPREKLELALSLLWKSFDVRDSDGCMKDYCILAVASRESLACALIKFFYDFRIKKVYDIWGKAWLGYFKYLTNPLTTWG